MQPVTHQPHPSHPSAHQLPHSAVTHALVHQLPLPAGITSSQNPDHHPSVGLPLPGISQHQQHRGGMNGPPDMFTHPGPGSYASLDAFQNRLGELQNTLNESMAKWNREGDPNQEIPHHEGLGL